MQKGSPGKISCRTLTPDTSCRVSQRGRPFPSSGSLKLPSSDRCAPRVRSELKRTVSPSFVLTYCTKRLPAHYPQTEQRPCSIAMSGQACTNRISAGCTVVACCRPCCDSVLLLRGGCVQAVSFWVRSRRVCNHACFCVHRRCASGRDSCSCAAHCTGRLGSVQYTTLCCIQAALIALPVCISTYTMHAGWSYIPVTKPMQVLSTLHTPCKPNCAVLAQADQSITQVADAVNQHLADSIRALHPTNPPAPSSPPATPAPTAATPAPTAATPAPTAATPAPTAATSARPSPDPMACRNTHPEVGATATMQMRGCMQLPSPAPTSPGQHVPRDTGAHPTHATSAQSASAKAQFTRGVWWRDQ